MAIPRSLSDWSLDALYELVDSDYHEDDFFDFKEVLGAPSSRYKDVVLKAACSLANSTGGFLVFGVSESGEGRERIKGIPDNRENAKHLSDKLHDAEPSLSYEIRNPPIRLDGGGVIFVVEIHRAAAGPHRGPGFSFWKRAQGTAVEMTYAEIQNGFINHAERQALLQLVFVSLAENWTRFQEMASTRNSDTNVSTHVPDVSQVRQHLGVVHALCPEAIAPLLSLLRETDQVSWYLSALMPVVHLGMTNKTSPI